MQPLASIIQNERSTNKQDLLEKQNLRLPDCIASVKFEEQERLNLSD